MRAFVLLLLAVCAIAGEPTRAEREAAALRSVMALDDGPRREAGLAVVRQAYAAFRADVAAAAQPIPAEADDIRRARLTALAERNRQYAALQRLDSDGAAGLLEAHLTRWPLDAEARALLGLALLRASDRDRAWDALLIALTLDPELAAARELRGRLLVARGDKADRELAAADLAPVISRLLVAGCAAEHAGDAAGAEAALAELAPLAAVVGTDQAQARLAALRGGAAERAGRFDQALDQWRLAAAAGLDQPDAAARVRALVRRLHADRVAPAVATGDVEALLTLSPAFPDHDALQDRLFRLLLLRGRLVQARDAARALLAAEPAHPLGRLIAEGAQAGLDPRRLELLPPFMARMRPEVVALGKRFPVVHGLDAALAELAGDHAGAAAALDPLLTALPDDRLVRWQRARLHLAAGDAAAARADIDLLLAGDPDDADAVELRSQIRVAAGDVAGALADADRLIILRPGSASLVARARLRQRLGDTPAVLADLAAANAAATGVGDVAALLEAAGLAEELRDEAAHRAALERAGQLGSADALQRLRRLRR